MKQQIINLFKLNRDRVLQDRKIPKSTFYDLDAFNTAKKRIFIEDISEISLLAILNEDTINIAAYKDTELNYSEIDIIYVELKGINNLGIIIETIQRNIPNPVILIFSYQESILIQSSRKRLSQAEADKQVIEEDFSTPWLNLQQATGLENSFLACLDISKFSFENLYSFYLEFTRLLYQSMLIQLLGEFRFYKHLDTEIIKSEIEKYLNKEKLIKHLKAEQIKTLEFSDKISLEQKIINLQAEAELIKVRIMEILRLFMEEYHEGI